jgi:hypothetical protein
MIRHIVFFKFKAETTPAERADFSERLRKLAGLPEVAQIEVGEDFLHTARSFDVALTVTFADRAALDSYQINPGHLPVPQRAREICEAIAAIDYEV